MNAAAFAHTELHLHLEGSIDAATLKELDPEVTDAEIAAKLGYSNFEGFIDAFVWENRKLRGPADYALVARRLFERLSRQGVSYAEVTPVGGSGLVEKTGSVGRVRCVSAEAARSPLQVRWILDAVRQWA